MNITKIELTDFRNYLLQSVNFSKALNIVEGANASGKTNLLEAVYFCGVGRSPRTSKDKELIRWGGKQARIALMLDKKYRSHKIEVLFSDNGQKRILIDGVPIRRMGELMGVLNVVYFSPDDLKLIKDSPKERRTFMDISLSQQSKLYFYTLLKYNRVLAERNKLLKTAKTLKELKETVYVWNSELSDYGARLTVLRLNFLSGIAPIAERAHGEIAGKSEILSLEYERSYSGNTYEELKSSLSEGLSADIEKEYSLGYTLTGLHRDDFSVKINGIDVRSFGSQGQQRTAALAIKLAEISYFEQKTGELPVLLLDDVLSELDESRRRALLRATDNIQTILTCTDFKENFGKPYKKITVSDGKIKV